MKDIFLADAHLHDPQSPNYGRLLQFLAELEGDTRTLFILGDLFEFWIGYRHTVFAPYVPILDALGRLRAGGTSLVYVEGNHDFHLGPYFEEVLGCRILPDGGEVQIDGRRVYIAHGDLVDPSDTGYRLLRKTLRSGLLRGLKNVIHPDLAWNIARWAGRQSRNRHGDQHHREIPRELLLRHARERLSLGCEAVLTAHYHLPWMHREPDGTVISIGDWITQYSYAVYEKGEFRLETY